MTYSIDSPWMKHDPEFQIARSLLESPPTRNQPQMHLQFVEAVAIIEEWLKWYPPEVFELKEPETPGQGLILKARDFLKRVKDQLSGNSR